MELMWIMLRNEGERGEIKEDHYGTPGWLTEGYMRVWINFLWPELNAVDTRRLSHWLVDKGRLHNVFVRLKDSRQRKGSERQAPGEWWVADRFDVDVVEEFQASKSALAKRGGEARAAAIADRDTPTTIAALRAQRDSVMKERHQLAEEVERLRRQVIAQAAEIAQFAIRDNTDSDEVALLREQLADRDAEIRRIGEAGDSQFREARREIGELRRRLGNADAAVTRLKEQVAVDATRNAELERRLESAPPVGEAAVSAMRLVEDYRLRFEQVKHLAALLDGIAGR